MIERFGPSCIPYLDAAIAAKPKPTHHAFLVKARNLFGKPTTKPKR